jgi:hypothetical protein
MIQKLPNLLLIAGTGRKSGKTTIACDIIQFYAKQYAVNAIKISPHKHITEQEKGIIIRNESSAIIEEFDTLSGKDSSRMLAAGAVRSFYIESPDDTIKEAFLYIYKKLPAGVPVICESPALISYISPGLFIIADHPAVHHKKEKILTIKSRADFLINIQQDPTQQFLDQITFQEGCWQKF